MHCLYKKGPYRIQKISKIIDGKVVKADIKEGVGVERLCENSKDNYYVLAFVWWDKNKIIYDPLPERIYTDMIENPKDQIMFKDILKKAKEIVYKANK